MAFRGGLGPVFAYEWLTATRRWQMYAGRAAFVGLLLAGLIFVWNAGIGQGTRLPTYRVQAELARYIFKALVFTELVMVMLAAPAAAAGAFCLDKARGTLLHVLVTDLSSTNGTMVEVPGEQPERVHPQRPVMISPGTRITMAEVATYVYEVGT